ncbi:MAG: hypothetical protein WC627_10855 [Legionella sp.]|jgi:hypothetical protein
MLNFFPRGAISTGEVKKYCSFNGVLSAAYYNPLIFNSHLLIALHATGTLKNLSFSFCLLEQGSSSALESMFSLGINQTSREADLSFNAGAVYYTNSVKITGALFENINKKIFKLYRHPRFQTNSEIRSNPRELLREFATCATIHENLIQTAHGTADSIRQNIPVFIELLVSKIDAELIRLDDEMKTPTVSFTNTK